MNLKKHYKKPSKLKFRSLGFLFQLVKWGQIVVIAQFSHLTAKEMCPKEIMFYLL